MPSWVKWPTRDSKFIRVDVYITTENQRVSRENPLSMAIFCSYVRLPKGITENMMECDGM